MNKPIITLKNVSKSYSGVEVLKNIDLEIIQGEVHAIVGANGAGKSTLIKIVSGAILPDHGVITVNWEDYLGMTPSLSSNLGIEVIYQEFNIIPSLSVAENIFLGQELSPNGYFDSTTLAQKAKEVLKVFDLDIDPKAQIKNLSVAYKQIIEIAKAISHDVKILILDEPTAPLSEKEVTILFTIIRQLQSRGVSIIYISHRLEEIFAISDRVTVLRDGKKISTYLTKDTNRREIIGDMINNTLEEVYPVVNYNTGSEVLKVKGVSGHGFKDINFVVHSGEVLGLEGLVGSKRTEIVRAIFGADRLVDGELFLAGQKITIGNPENAINLGIVMIPEDRKNQGLIGNLPVRWNMTLAILRTLQKIFVIDSLKEKILVNKFLDALHVKLREDTQPVSTLSGGNQQKVVVAKWLASNPKVIIMDEPTRGIDVGAKKEIYNLISKLAHDGMAIILISSDLDEMIGLCNRMLILSEGQAMAELSHDNFEKQLILDYASGTK
jgi:ribose transport system ATP-binding protein